MGKNNKQKNFDKIWDMYGKDIIEMRKQGYMCKEIGEVFNINPRSIQSFLSRNNVRIRGNKNDQKVISKICEMYNQGIGMNKIADAVHLYEGTIKNILLDNDIPIRDYSHSNRKYSLNENYFDVIDTGNKAYILGFLYADGCRSGSSNTITLSLQDKDKEILEKINLEIGSNRPLGFIDNSYCRPRRDQYKLSICSKNMVTCLYKYGIVPNKEFKLTFPEWLDYELIPHFIRGYLDGDGSISKNPKEKRVQITGIKMMCEGIAKYLSDELNVHSSIYSPHHKDTITRTLGIAGGVQVKKVLDKLYENANLFLKRKHDIYSKVYCSDVINKSYVA